MLLPNRLSYRPLEVDRLEAAFDAQAGIRRGRDPPPGPLEAGCLQRAWKRFLTRVQTLKHALGQMLPAGLASATQLWRQLRHVLGRAEDILRFLAQQGKRSLLGDYTCLRPAPSRGAPRIGTWRGARGPPRGTIPQNRFLGVGRARR